MSGRGRADSQERRQTRTVSARKERPAAEHLRHNAPYAPDVDRARVLLEGEHDLRGAVPPGDDTVNCAGCAGAG